MIKKTYTITNMECPNCAMILESIEDELPGILKVEASYHKGQLTVEFDERQFSDARILAEIQRKGYLAG